MTTAKIADSNVTTAKIADSNVTTAKIADGTISTSDLASSIGINTLSAGNVTVAGNLSTSGNLSVTGNLIATGAANLLGLMYPSVDGSTNQFLSTQGNGHLVFSSANVIMNNASVTGLNVTGGTINNTAIGATTASSGNFTTMHATSGNLIDFIATSGNVLSLSAGNLTVTGNTTLGNDISSDNLYINSMVAGQSAGGNVWFMGNLISSANTYSLGIATKPWASIYAIRLVTTSDARLKKDVQPIAYGLDTLLKLNPVSYEWKHLPNPRRTLGLLAQDVEKLIAEVVTEDSGKEKRLGIQYQHLIPVLIQAIKDQQNLIEAQKSKEVELKTEVDDLNQRLLRLEALLLRP